MSTGSRRRIRQRSGTRIAPAAAADSTHAVAATPSWRTRPRATAPPATRACLSVGSRTSIELCATFPLAGAAVIAAALASTDACSTFFSFFFFPRSAPLLKSGFFSFFFFFLLVRALPLLNLHLHHAFNLFLFPFVFARDACVCCLFLVCVSTCTEGVLMSPLSLSSSALVLA